MRPNLEATVISNMAGHELIRMPMKRGKRCIAHSKYQPNKKKKKRFTAAFSATAIFAMIDFVQLIVQASKLPTAVLNLG